MTKKKKQPLSNAEKKRAFHFRAGDISPIPKVKGKKRREKCRENFELFCKTYLKHLFYRPFSADQLDIIQGLEKAIKTGGKKAEALPRGSGKTTIGEAAAIWAALYGWRRFFVLIGSTDQLIEEIGKDIKIELETNPLLLADFPEVCYPIVRLDGRYARARAQHCAGTLTKMVWTGKQISFPMVEGSDVSGTIIRVTSITSAIRGMKKGKARPDFVLLDDPQTRESAESISQTDKREKTIQGDAMGLAGHDKMIAAYMTCTVIYKGDLADRYLDNELHPDWVGKRRKLVYAWPERKQWEEYDDLWKSDHIAGDSEFKSATEFYKANRAVMDRGVHIADPSLYDSPVEVSAIQHARNLKLADPGAFEAEYQNEPVSRAFLLYQLDSKTVRSRCNNLPKHKLDRSVRLITSFCDINFSGLHWAMCGFRNDRTAFVIDYGNIPGGREVLIEKNSNAAEIKRKIYSGLDRYTSYLNDLSLRIPIRAVGIDRGFQPETVHNFCNYKQTRYALLPAKGYGSTQYRPGRGLVGKAGVECHVNESQFGQYFAANSCYFREAVQRGFLSQPGQSGSCSFYGKDPARHSDIAEHICAESLTDKAEGRERMFYKWDMKPGAVNDWLDAVVGCYALATWFLGELTIESTVGGRGKTRRKRKAPRRKAKIQIED